MQATGTGIGTTNSGRIIANEVTRIQSAPCETNVQAGLIGASGITASSVTALGNYIHDGGCPTTSKLEHTFYISNRSGVPIGATELGWNYLNNTGVYGGLHVYDEGICGGWTGIFQLHDNVVINQLGEAASYGMNCTMPITAPMNMYNNLFVNAAYDLLANKLNGNGGHNQVIGIGGPITGAIKIYNNTIYSYGDNVPAGIYSADGYAIYLGYSMVSGCWTGSVDFANNIIVNTGGVTMKFYGNDGCAAGFPTAHSHNLWFNTAGGPPPPPWDLAPLNSDPLMVNPQAGSTNSPVVGGNYALQLGSPAINAGANTGPTVTMDILGAIRSQAGTAYDIGAYEYSTGVMTVTAPPAAPRGFALK